MLPPREFHCLIECMDAADDHVRETRAGDSAAERCYVCVAPSPFQIWIRPGSRLETILQGLRVMHRAVGRDQFADSTLGDSADHDPLGIKMQGRVNQASG